MIFTHLDSCENDGHGFDNKPKLYIDRILIQLAIKS